jgi:hypothetical protein
MESARCTARLGMKAEGKVRESPTSLPSQTAHKVGTVGRERDGFCSRGEPHRPPATLAARKRSEQHQEGAADDQAEAAPRLRRLGRSTSAKEPKARRRSDNTLNLSRALARVHRRGPIRDFAWSGFPVSRFHGRHLSTEGSLGASMVHEGSRRPPTWRCVTKSSCYWMRALPHLKANRRRTSRELKACSPLSSHATNFLGSPAPHDGVTECAEGCTSLPCLGCGWDARRRKPPRLEA